MGVIFSETFNTATVPALPAGWLVSAGYATSTAQSRSAPNSLVYSSSGTAANTFRTGSMDGKDGNIEADVWIRADNPGTTSLAQLILRSSINTAAGAYNAYRIQIAFGSSTTTSQSVLRRNGSTDTTLLSRTPAQVSFDAAAWYRMIVRVETYSDRVRLRVWVQRASDGLWLNSALAWQASKATTIDLDDTSASRVTGQGYIGLRCLAQTGASVHVDDLVLRDLTALPPGVFGTGSSLIRPAWSPGGLVPLIRG